jgi:hypothetical protein
MERAQSFAFLANGSGAFLFLAWNIVTMTMSGTPWDCNFLSAFEKLWFPI